ncbi:hypothetical protein IF2G_01606 [Cordyceps javanica]|nr:hypothetical protein IF2G_01606 [Cordyceps javanica]
MRSDASCRRTQDRLVCSRSWTGEGRGSGIATITTYRLWWAVKPRLPVAGVSRADWRSDCRLQEKGRRRSDADGESEPAGRCRSSKSRRKALKEPD